jgi:hypothetical protein
MILIIPLWKPTNGFGFKYDWFDEMGGISDMG